jgi:hypothetical protein
MTSINQDFNIYAGDAYEITFTLTNAAGGSVTLTTATAKWWITRSDNSRGSDFVVKKDHTAGILLTGSTAVVTLNPSDTDSLSPGNYYHELEISFSANEIHTFAKGKVKILSTIIPNS